MNNIISRLLDSRDTANVKIDSIFYKQIAVIMMGVTPYFLLRPLTVIKGAIKKKLAFAYIQNDDNLVAVTDAKKNRAIFKKYYRLFSQYEKGEVTKCGSVIKSNIPYESFLLVDDKHLTEIRRNAITLKKHREINKAWDTFKEYIKGQNAAIAKIVKAVFGKMTNENNSGPLLIGCFGAPGVGKTASANLLSKLLGIPILFIAGSVYSDEQSAVLALLGSEKNYKGSWLGIISRFVFKHGHCIVLIDEFDQLAASVRERLWQIFSEGVITDNCLGLTVSVSNVIFIISSNRCKDLYDSGFNMADIPLERITASLGREIDSKGRPLFPPALISRMVSTGILLIFNNLVYSSKKEIVAAEIERIAKNKSDITYTLDPVKLGEAIVLNNVNFDARELKGELRKMFEDITFSANNIIGEIYPESFVDVISIEIDDFRSIESVKSLTPKKKHKLLCFGDLEESKKMKNVEVISGTEDIDSYFISNSEVDSILIDATDSIDRARRIFKAVKDRTHLPIYVFTRKDNIAKSQVLSFEEQGANEIYIPSCNRTLSDWLLEVATNLEFNAMCRTFCEKALKLAHTIDYSLEGHTLHVKLSFDIESDANSYEYGKIKCFESKHLRQIALHEASHAICSHALGFTPDIISVISRGNVGGSVTYSNTQVFQTEAMLRNRICIALAGRVGEMLILGKEDGVNSGALSDLKSATQIANEMLTNLGMAGSLSVGGEPNKEQLDQIINSEYKRTEEMLLTRLDVISRVADALCKKRTLNKEEFERIVLC